MTGLKRSLIYWGRSLEKFYFLILFMSVAMVSGMSILYGGLGYGGVFSYIPMIFSISFLALAYTNITTSLSNIIAMGSTRRDSFLGMQIVFHLMVLQGMLLTVIAIWIMPQAYATDKVTLCKYIVALYVVSCTLGNVINIAVMRCGMNTAKIIYIGTLIVIIMLDIFMIQLLLIQKSVNFSLIPLMDKEST